MITRFFYIRTNYI